jgi:hypothetical protein
MNTFIGLVLISWPEYPFSDLLFGKNKLALVGDAQAVLFTDMLDHQLSLRLEQIATVDALTGGYAFSRSGASEGVGLV